MRVAPPAGGRALGGVALSLLAAAAFGAFAPAAKESLADVAPVRAAGWTYLAAGVVAALALVAWRAAGLAPAGRVPKRRDAPRLAGMTLLGGVAGPILFFSGIARVEAHRAAIVQHLEFALTVVAAVVVLGERPGRRGLVGLVLVASGLVVLSRLGAATPDPGRVSTVPGLALLGAACVAWAADNTLARGASDLDPLTVVSLKGLGAGVVLLAVARPAGSGLPSGAWAPILLAGGVGVGASLVLELLALRRVGAAINAGLFATGPAMGFAWSVLILCERAAPVSWGAVALCALGAVALATDRHEHLHVHVDERGSVEHAHPHVHDAGHRHRH
jgi:drug/metabolite transporter (DMT)-like permease